MLTPYLPFPLMTGGQTRSFNLIKRLSKLGHEIYLFSLVKKEEEKKYIFELEKYCKEVEIFNRPDKPWSITNILTTGFSAFPFLVIRNWAKGERAAIKEALRKEKFDLIHAETFYVMPHIPKTNIPIVLVDQTIEYKVYQHYVENYKHQVIRPLLFLDVAKLKYWELKYWKQATKVIAMSEDDKKTMLFEVPKLDVDIVPNGVDCGFFAQKIAKKSKYPVVMYLGNFTWLQNREAISILINSVWPIIKKQLKNCKLWIIGKDAESFFSSLRNEDIRVEEVKDVRIAYQGAHILVAPIYSGHGTRLKNFETFASGIPVVTTSIGIGGTDAEDGKEVVIRDKPEDIANAAVELLNNPKLYNKIAENAKKMVIQKYDWDSIAMKLSNIYKEVAKS